LSKLGAQIIETETHPYEDNLDKYWTVHLPGAKEIQVAFDSCSSTENNYDFVHFYRDDTHTTTWGEEKYTGGMGGTPKKFPLAHDPLVIPSDTFVVHFHSDGSNHGWEFLLLR
jgi:hypothetical protein